MLLVFTVLAAILFIMLAKQYDLVRGHEKEILLRHFKERIVHLDNLLAVVTEQVNGMRLVAEADLLQTRAVKTWNQPLEFNFLAEVSGENRFHLEAFNPPLTREMIGNLTGEGSLKDRDDDFYREIHMALALNPQFRVVAGAIRHAAWVYYTSRNDFINIYPWVSSGDFKFSEELQTHEFYTLGLPDKNPDRKRFWTKVYVDEYGQGLMTTCAAPVYDHDRFVGTVAVDLTVDFLNTVLQEFNPNQGVMFLVNENNQLLAHPTLITSDDKKAKTFSDALPEALRGSIESLLRIPEDKVSHVRSYDILPSHLNQAPWQVFYLAPASSFWSSLKKMIGLGPLTVLAMLLILVVAVLVVTEKQFVLPSKKFVNYIMARSQKKQTRMDNGVPGVWKPWFVAVDKVFSENEKLAQELREQNEALEQRVSLRTVELEKEIEERRQAQEALREREERLRAIFNNADVGIVVVNPQGRFIQVNSTWTEMLGWSAGELEQLTLQDVSHPQDRDDSSQAWEALRCGRLDGHQSERRIVRKDGSVLWIDLTVSPIWGQEGRIEAVIGVGLDITDRKKVHAEKLNREKLQAVVETAGAICHELNQPLQVIMASLDLLLMSAKDENMSRRLKTIDKEIERITGITAKLQQTTRYEIKKYLKENTILDIDKTSTPGVS